MVERQSSAVEYLRNLVRAGSVEAAESLESLATATATVSAESLMPQGPMPDKARSLVERTVQKIADGRELEAAESYALEAIIIPDKRPVLDVLQGGAFHVDHPLWRGLLDPPVKARITAAIPAVGRVELPDHPRLPYGGTGFVVGEGLVMTNRHVAEIFAEGLGVRTLRFRSGLKAGFDLERRRDGGSLLLNVIRVAMIHPYWDMALLAVEGLPDTISPLALDAAAPAAGIDVVAMGYPAFDPRNDAQVQNDVFHNVYDVKRLMPGRLTGRGDTSSFGKTVSASTHDSSTLGGASGSAVVDVGSGAVVALHFGGLYLKTNYGVPASELARDGRVIDAGVRFSGQPARASGPWDRYWEEAERTRAEAAVPAAPRRAAAAPPQGRVSITLPLTVTVEIGGAQIQAAVAPATPVIDHGPDDLSPVEAPVEDYRDREGYRADFLGSLVPLPEVIRAKSDILPVPFDEQGERELRYQHFSVVMNRRRRLCFFSAVNIDGGQSRKAARVGWRRDPRIPASAQILNECYGDPPRFSRGHMTRREDPVWGAEQAAAIGNADSMHVTNAVPQMQAFNSPIWLALEDYALEHARQDQMRISVFTGPYFDDVNDPVLYGVQVPVKFWKVIAFIHDRTGRLCATGYEMNQQGVLPSATEFVFGEFRSRQLGVATQTSIRSIEARSGLSFQGLADVDPKSTSHEALAGADVELGQIEDVVFF